MTCRHFLCSIRNAKEEVEELQRRRSDKWEWILGGISGLSVGGNFVVIVLCGFSWLSS